jgi:DNA-directed RNA polymerase specialized sigma24 family protein
MEPARALGIHMTMRGGEANTSGRALPETAKSDFTAFYEQEFTQAARFAWLLVRSSAVAEDLAQEAFVALSRRFEEIDNPRGFVHRVVVNQARTWQAHGRAHASLA